MLVSQDTVRPWEIVYVIRHCTSQVQNCNTSESLRSQILGHATLVKQLLLKHSSLREGNHGEAVASHQKLHVNLFLLLVRVRALPCLLLAHLLSS